jgi:hypothetical protein
VTYASVQAAHDALMASLEALNAELADADQFRVVGDLAELTDPPAVALAPPSLSEFTESGPRVARWTAAMVVPAGDRVVGELFRLLPQVVSALDGTADAIVIRAESGVYRAGATELPAYFITIEVAL